MCEQYQVLAVLCSMMRTFEVTTVVQASLEKIQQNFTADLFSRLNPPFPPVKLLHFGGNETGAEVILEMNFLLFKQRWVSRITAAERTENRWFFVDEGIDLPFFLRSWKHIHLVEQSGKQSSISDQISLSGPTWIPDILLLWLFKALMLYRKPVYRRIFGAI
jgi:ligand-binding SRPBCC domain-containing protein